MNRVRAIAIHGYVGDECPANAGVNGEWVDESADAYAVRIKVSLHARGYGVRRRDDGNDHVLWLCDHAYAHGLPSTAALLPPEKVESQPGR